MSYELLPYFVTQLDSRKATNDTDFLIHSPTGCFDIRFFTLARSIDQVYKAAHDFLFECWNKKIELEGREHLGSITRMHNTMKVLATGQGRRAPSMTTLEFEHIGTVCTPFFSFFEQIDDPEEIGVLNQGERNLTHLQTLPEDDDRRDYIITLKRLLWQRLTYNLKDLSSLRKLNAVIEIASVSRDPILHRV